MGQGVSKKLRKQRNHQQTSLSSSQEEQNYGSLSVGGGLSNEQKPTSKDGEETTKLSSSLTGSLRRPAHRRTQSHSLTALGRPPSYRRRQNEASRSLNSLQQHRRHHSLSHIIQDFEHDARDQLSQAKDALVEEMVDLDNGTSPYFMDMSLMRSMSVLPEDLTEFVNETVYLQDIRELVTDDDQDGGEGIETTLLETPGDSGKVAETSAASVGLAYGSLLLAVVAVSSNGTALHLLKGVAPALKLYWRMTVTASILAIFALKSLVWNKTRMDLTFSQWVTLGLATVAFTAHTLLLFTALEYTTVGNAIIYGNSQALLLIVGKALVGEPVTWGEGLGVVTAVIGALLCSLDSEESASDDPHHTVAQARWGDAMALLSAVAGVAYLTLAKTVRHYVPVTLFMFLVMWLGSFLVLAFLLLSGTLVTWDRHVHTGLWGWMTLEGDHLWILLHIALVCNLLGTMGFVRAMAFFDTIIIAVATLLEPMMASVIAYIFHVGLLPGWLGYLGNALVTMGTVAVVLSSVGKSDSSDMH